MSTAAVHEFREAVNTDGALKDEFRDAVKAGGVNVVAFAAKHGYEFTGNELKEVVGSLDQLTDFELEMVAGGGDVMKALFKDVLKGSIDETNSDKIYFMSKLEEKNEIAEAYGDHLEDLVDATASEGEGDGTCGGG